LHILRIFDFFIENNSCFLKKFIVDYWFTREFSTFLWVLQGPIVFTLTSVHAISNIKIFLLFFNKKIFLFFKTSSSAVSSNTHLVIAANAARARNSQSIGSLPTNSVLATSFQNAQTNNAVMVIPSAKTPPKYSTSSG